MTDSPGDGRYLWITDVELVYARTTPPRASVLFHSNVSFRHLGTVLRSFGERWPVGETDDGGEAEEACYCIPHYHGLSTHGDRSDEVMRCVGPGEYMCEKVSGLSPSIPPTGADWGEGPGGKQPPFALRLRRSETASIY